MPASTLADPLCEDCSHPITAATAVSTVEGEKLCSDCAAEVPRCDECAAHTREPRVTVHETYLCSQCLIGWQRCTDCDRYTREATAIVGGGDACEQCGDNYDSCADCGNRATDTYAVDSRGRVCDNCQEDYRECADCYTLVPREETYCESCGDNHNPSHSRVHDWSYKPTPRFHGEGPLFLGLELEIKIPRGVFTEAVDTAVDDLGKAGYLKEDSSIRPCGFELVTHPVWNLLACNDSFGAATAVLSESEQLVPAWLFSPRGKTLFLDWLGEATHTVASHKTILGRYRDSEQARHFMQILGQNPEFVRLWTSSIRVAYGRNTSDLLHLLDPATDEPASYSLSISNVTQTEHVLLVTVIRKPYSGPPLQHPLPSSRHASTTRR
ncbi:hypothetical protein [Nocardia sp. bgisy118]|uniref:MmyB family transcriptional regulator n=1 Tax=Nocardia sp. bgisy118 TaxID=3413786 RepID=UPI003F4A7D5C